MPPSVRNVLFIMCDQLRYDYLGCTGHPRLRTPAIDALAADGLRFDQAYIQAPLCGPSRMSFYTGRYMFCHGATWNFYPMRADEWTMGDYLRQLGVRTALVGKTHMIPDLEGFRRLGVDPGSASGQLAAQCGFEPFERDDGLHPDPIVRPDLAYNRWLREQGYDEVANPWDAVANAVGGDHGEILSGWHMRNVHRPARVAGEHSETAYMTNRAMDFIRDAGEQPWCLHLSYIKPHWPYVAPAPYHDMYGIEDLVSPQRSEAERRAPHPVHAAFMQLGYSRNFSRDEVRARVLPVYMGLISEIDAHLARLFAFLRHSGRWNDTLIVLTSDHGDYMGDHWLGEKDLHHDPSIRIPLIVRHPGREADATRGTVAHHLVEAIDLLPTFFELLGGQGQPYRMEGRSLASLLRGEEVAWRDAAFSEIEFSLREEARHLLQLPPERCRGFVARTNRWKYVLYEGFEPILYDLVDDPFEYVDRGRDPACGAIRAEMHERIFTWLRQRRTRVTVSEEDILTRYKDFENRSGLLIGCW